MLCLTLGDCPKDVSSSPGWSHVSVAVVVGFVLGGAAVIGIILVIIPYD